MTSGGTSQRPALPDWARAQLDVWAVATVALVVFVGAALVAPVTGDEPTFADPARSAAAGAGFGAPVLDGIVPGAGARLMWQPPGYFVLLAAWFRLFGFGLVQGRMLSVLAATGAVVLVYVFARRFARAWSAVAAVAVAGVSSWTLRAAAVIRPDTLVLAAIAGAAVAAVMWEDRRTAVRGAWLVAAMSVAVLMHPLGVVAALFVLIYLGARRDWLAAVGFPALASAVVVAAWWPYVASYWPEFVEQMRLQGLRKDAAGPLALWFSQDGPRKLGFGPVVAAVVVLLVLRRRVPLAPVLLAVLATAAAIYGKEEQYPVYVVLFAAPLVAVAIDRVAGLTRLRVLATVTATALGLAVLVPGAVLLARGVAELGVGNEIVAATGPRPLFLGPGSYSVYFVDGAPPVKVSAPVPTDLAAVGRVVRGQGMVVSDDTKTLLPLVGDAVLRPAGVAAGRQLWSAS